MRGVHVEWCVFTAFVLVSLTGQKVYTHTHTHTHTHTCADSKHIWV